jgi:predicted DNA-binding transcriptional regulator YafY
VRYRIDPQGFVLYQHALYVTAYSHTSKGDRLFLVDRMNSIKLTDERFALPEKYSAGDR